jgi:hypothetical protein
VQNISDLLAKFSKFAEPEKVLREKLSEVIKQKTGIEISWRDISVKNSRVSFNNLSPAAKQEINLHHQIILMELPEKWRRVGF